MKKFTVFAVLCVLLAAVLTAAADSIWTPIDDYFFEAWDPESDQTCERQERPLYMAAGKDGYVTAVRTPLDQTAVATYPNGTVFQIAFICGKGDSQWGTIQAVRPIGEDALTEDYNGTSGYIALGELVRAFDSEAFIAMHQDEMRDFTEDSYNFCAGDEFTLWSAPNSGIVLEQVSKGYIDYLCMDYAPDAEYKMFHFGKAWTDPDGNEWAEVTLRQVTERGWMYLGK